jgi:arylsulfatase A-like enzyme
MATVVEITGATYPRQFKGHAIQPMEGVSLRAAFNGRPLVRTQPIFWEHEGNRAIRDGKWKLVAKENQPWELYDIEADRAEQHNLAVAQPERVKQMAAKWDAWAAKSMVAPLGAWRRAVVTSGGKQN